MTTRGRKPKMRFDLIPDDFMAFGYIREEDGVFTAICVNLSLFGEGDTPQEAFDRLKESFETYIEFVVTKHPDEVEKYLHRPVDKEYQDEFSEILEAFRTSVTKQTGQSKRIHIPNPFIAPYRTLAPQVSAAHA